MSRCFLSKLMRESETCMVYSGAYHSNLPNTNNFSIASSQSQGFTWNQDLFASQYQQMCKVVYDGHEDTLEELIETIKEKYKLLGSHCAEDDDKMVYEDDDEALTDCENDEFNHGRTLRFFRRSNSGYSLRPRISEEFNRPRRISERSISFVSDSKNGKYNRSDIAVIDVEADTPENNHLKWLISPS